MDLSVLFLPRKMTYSDAAMRGIVTPQGALIFLADERHYLEDIKDVW